jgi:hypothetical protein
VTPLIRNGIKLVIALTGEHTRNRLLVFTKEIDPEPSIFQDGAQRFASVV